MNDNVNHPPHYEDGFAVRPLECIDVTRHCDFCSGNAVKYIWRAGKKDNALEDLAKAEWYLYEAILEYNEIAMALFQLVEKPKSGLEYWRYKTIYDILCNSYTTALKGIEEMRKILKEEAK